MKFSKISLYIFSISIENFWVVSATVRVRSKTMKVRQWRDSKSETKLDHETEFKIFIETFLLLSFDTSEFLWIHELNV